MGGRAMPLLSTLAALVIIVHSQEELDVDYQRDLAPRRLEEPARAEYEEEWRTVRSEPTAQQSVQVEHYEDPPTDLAPRRRRPGRKRKRRPVTALRDSEERRFYHEEPPPYGNGEYPAQETTETPVQRRKRPEMQDASWADAPHRQDRPIRRRGQRRHRPKGSQYDVYPPETRPRRPHKEYVSPDRATSDEQDVPQRQEATIAAEEDGETLDRTNKEVNQFEEKGIEESLSIVSGEQTKVEKGAEDLSKLNQQANDAIDPITLKEILKRSNGSSLSEILQQNNLSLSDLLHGKQNAISILKNEEKKIGLIQTTETPSIVSTTQIVEIIDLAGTTETNNNTIISVDVPNDEVKSTNDTETSKSLLKSKEKLPKISTRRRMKFDGRRRLRLRTPLLNMPSARFQATRDFISPKFRKQLNENNSGYSTPMTDIGTDVASESNNYSTTTKEPEQSEVTTVSVNQESTQPTEYVTAKEDVTTQPNLVDNEITTSDNDIYVTNDDMITTTDATITTVSIEVETEFISSTTPTTTSTTTTTEKPVSTFASVVRRPLTNSELRRQALANRLKKKRLRQKNLTTEAPQEDLNKNVFDLENYMSASEHFAKPKNTRTPNKEDFKLNDLPDLLENEASMHVEKSQRITPTNFITRAPQTPFTSTTEEISRVEIEELFNDTDTGARISKILMERNMTLSELAEHRERGSSHVHLADIFHNTSREPNPPEPFLSKSLIEPISKEIYPLRALLDANIHDPTNKLPTTDIYPPHEDTNIPIVIDFKNNVNENGENMGIASLFNKVNGLANVPVVNSEGTSYIATSSHDNVTHDSGNTREGRQMEELKETLSLKDIFSMVQMNYHNQSMEVPESLTKGVDAVHTTVSSAEDSDGDGLIVIDDLQRLKDYDSQTSASGEKIDFDMTEEDVKPGILKGMPSKAKSITVITASIVGLTMIVFLLTYTLFKWRQQRKERNKDALPERIPTPVYESRKSTKTRSSNRSISPMLTNNIYTMSTMDSRNGLESPDYMWDSLRKPFQ